MSETGDAATRVVLSYPADLSKWGRDQLDARHFEAYLRRTHDEVHEGDVWEEFLDVGCCGDTLDVPFRVERVDGGSRTTEDTAFEWVEREACGVGGGWNVQSAGGPEATTGRQ